MQAKLDELPRYEIVLGVPSEETERKENDVISLGITNAELMFIHENGSPIRGIPRRPVLAKTLQHIQDEGWLDDALDDAIEAYFDSNFVVSEFEKQLNSLCIDIENYVRENLRQNNFGLKPNSPSTIARKGSNVPLIDTGQLANSIRCYLVKKNESNGYPF